MNSALEASCGAGSSCLDDARPAISSLYEKPNLHFLQYAMSFNGLTSLEEMGEPQAGQESPPWLPGCLLFSLDIGFRLELVPIDKK